MTRVLGFLKRYFSNYYTLHRSDLAARAAPLDPRLVIVNYLTKENHVHFSKNDRKITQVKCKKMA